MPLAVQLTDDAAHDLEEIFEYLTEHEESSRAEHVLGRIGEAFQGLSTFPERGNYPRELLEIGIREYREVLFRPYRIIYRVKGDTVYILVIADGRRDMRTLLQRRLLAT